METHSKTLELYVPHSVQLKIHNSKARYRVAALGRQAGKSTACLNDLLARAWENPGTKYWFISPTYDQAKNQYRRLMGMLSPCWEILLKKNQTELRIKLINQSEINFKSGEVLHNLRGETLNGVVIDEVREQPSQLWSQIIQPMLRTTRGWAMFVSTPNGYDSFYDLFERGRTDTSGQWECFQSPSTCNPLFSNDEFENAKKEMSEAEFDQEILAKFRDITSGKAYISGGQHNHRLDSPFTRDGSIKSPHLPIIVAMDFNISPMAWTIGQYAAGKFYWFDSIWLEGSHTQEAALELVERVKGHAPGVILAGDATSKASQRAAAGQSDYDIVTNILRSAGIKFSNITPDSNPSVKDRVNTFNAKCKAADGTVSMWWHPDRCKPLDRDVQRVVWKVGAEATLEQTKDRTLTHASDGVGYAVFALDPIQSTGSVGRLRVIKY